MSLRTILLCVAAMIAALGLWLLLDLRHDGAARVATLSADGIMQVAISNGERVAVAPRGRAATVSSIASPLATNMPGPAQPLPPPNVKLADIYPELERLAKDGSLPAMCRLAFEMERCRRLPSLRKTALEWRLKAEESPLASAFAQQRTLEGVASLQRQSDALEPVCAGFPIETTHDSWKYELSAVEAGHAPSIARFVWRGPPRDLPTIVTLDAWNVYRDQAPQLLQRAVDAGEPGAFEVAAVAHERGQWQGLAIVPADPVRAAAYWMALERRASPQGANRFGNAWQRVQRAAGLTQDQVVQAQALAAQLAPKLRPPPGGVDFSHGTFAADDGRHCEAP